MYFPRVLSKISVKTAIFLAFWARSRWKPVFSLCFEQDHGENLYFPCVLSKISVKTFIFPCVLSKITVKTCIFRAFWARSRSTGLVIKFPWGLGSKLSPSWVQAESRASPGWVQGESRASPGRVQPDHGENLYFPCVLSKISVYRPGLVKCILLYK